MVYVRHTVVDDDFSVETYVRSIDVKCKYFDFSQTAQHAKS